MILADVMQAVADRAGELDGLRVYPEPPGKVDPPAFVVSYPEEWRFDQTYARGMDYMRLPAVLVVGKVIGREVRLAISDWCEQLKPLLESGTYAMISDLHVSMIDFDVVSIAGVDHLAGLFTMDIRGNGS
jgi:hypothetical protein